MDQAFHTAALKMRSEKKGGGKKKGGRNLRMANSKFVPEKSSHFPVTRLGGRKGEGGGGKKEKEKGGGKRGEEGGEEENVMFMCNHP